MKTSEVSAKYRLEDYAHERLSRFVRYNIAWDGRPELVRTLFKYEVRLRTVKPTWPRVVAFLGPDAR